MTRCMEQIGKCVGGLDKRSTKFSRPIGQWIKVDDDHIQFLNSFIRAERRNLSNITEEEEEEEEKEEGEGSMGNSCWQIGRWVSCWAIETILKLKTIDSHRKLDCNNISRIKQRTNPPSPPPPPPPPAVTFDLRPPPPKATQINHLIRLTWLS